MAKIEASSNVRNLGGQLQIEDIIEDTKNLDNMFVKVGVLGSAGSDMVQIATANEFGTTSKKGNQHIPSRPFIRQTFDRREEDLKKFSARLAQLVAAGKMQPDKALSLLGQKFQADIRNAINNEEFTPNAPQTIKQKKSDRPLIDTGRLNQAISYELE